MCFGLSSSTYRTCACSCRTDVSAPTSLFLLQACSLAGFRKKIHFHRQLSDLLQKSVTLAPQRLYLFTLRFLVLEDDAGFLHELFSPFRDLLGRYLVLLGQVAQCLTFLHCVQYDLGLERGIILAFPSHFFHFFTKISLSRHLCFCLNSGEHYIHQLHFHIYHFPLLVSFHYLSTIL